MKKLMVLLLFLFVSIAAQDVVTKSQFNTGNEDVTKREIYFSNNTVYVPAFKHSSAKIKLISVNGKTVFNRIVRSVNGSLSCKINRHCAKGFYWLQVRCKEKSVAMPIVLW